MTRCDNDVSVAEDSALRPVHERTLPSIARAERAMLRMLSIRVLEVRGIFAGVEVDNEQYTMTPHKVPVGKTSEQLFLVLPSITVVQMLHGRFPRTPGTLRDPTMSSGFFRGSTMTREMISSRSTAEYACAAESGPVLVAVKPDDMDNRALPAAQWLAEHTGRPLHAISVIDRAPPISPFAAGTPAVPPFHDVLERNETSRQLRELLERSEQQPSSYRVDTLEGSPALTITQLAREHGATVTVIGTGTHGKLSRLIHGEQTLEILHRSRCPVLVVPPAATFPIVRAMVAVDFSAASKAAALATLDLLGAGGCLTLIDVKHGQPTFGNGAGWQGVARGKRRRESLSRFAASLPAKPGVVVETTVLRGSPAEVLLTYAYDHDMQLLAFGWHDHAPLERIFVHSNAVELLHRAVCMVLAAPAPRAGGGTGDAA